MFLRFYSRAGVAASTPGAAFACSVIAGRHGDWWVSRIEQRNKQDTGRERVEREREKRKRRDPRGRRETEGERAGEQKGTVPCDGVLAEERRRPLYCGGPIFLPPSQPPTTYSDVRVLENYYLNKYIHGGKFETSFLKIFFLNFKNKNRNSICQSKGSLNDMNLLTTDIKIIKSQYIIISQ